MNYGSAAAESKLSANNSSDRSCAVCKLKPVARGRISGNTKNNYLHRLPVICMKHTRLLTILFVSVCTLFFLQNCKKENTGNHNTNTDPDSFYTNTPYILNIPFGFPSVSPAADNPLSKDGIQLGRMLFYDPVLSSDSTFSCSSCHKQQYAFADGGKALSQNINGLTKRNTPPLFNLLWRKSYFWDGRAVTLTEQISDALQHEQNFTAPVAIARLQNNATYVGLFKKAFGRPGDITQDKIQKAIAQFVSILISADSKYDRVKKGQDQWSQSELNGFNLFLGDTVFHGADCFSCHSANASASILTLNDELFHNNALDSAAGLSAFPDLGRGGYTAIASDNGKFKTPQIRNIELTGPYMRDGRYTTLDQVLNFYNDSLKISPTNDTLMKTAYRGGLHYLSAQNKQDIIAFLKMLTDTGFINNTAFSNPFH